MHQNALKVREPQATVLEIGLRHYNWRPRYLAYLKDPNKRLLLVSMRGHVIVAFPIGCWIKNILNQT